MTHSIHYLTADRKKDFEDVMDARNPDASKCFCTAYFFDDYEANGVARRAAMFAANRMDGYLLYVDGQPAGWCQCAPLSSGLRLPKDFAGATDTWGITCMVIRKAYQGRGLATAFMKSILADLPKRGCLKAIAVGHDPSTYDNPDEFVELPNAVCEKAGMARLRDHTYGAYYIVEFPAAS